MSPPRAEPVYFGPVERPLFGWIHRPESGPHSSLGVVLCNPFGYEGICTHRTLRHFALSAAAAGIPALRFDYDGTGDSAGDDLDPDRLSAWVASVHGGVATLRRETGCERFCLLGIRLGATVAALAASERSDVEGLIALAPVVNGKAYTRELRALQMATGIAPAETDASGDGLTEVTGFVLTAPTRAALSALDLSKRERAPARQILILDRNDLPGNERWAAHLQATGATVERRAMPGYVEMMLSPHAAAVPGEMVRLAVGWLRDRASSMSSAHSEGTDATADSRHSVPLSAALSSGVAITETPVFLDPDRILFGILSTPQSASPGARLRRGILLLNAGGTHRVGPNRLYVTLARRWASLGHAVLRMDISGIGDSLPRPGEAENAIYTANAPADIQQGIRYLRERAGASECCAIGLCSGAYHAFKAAVRGLPLESVVMINPLTFFWKDGMSLDAPLPDRRVISEAHRYQKTAFRMQSWLKLMRGQVNVGRVVQILVRRTGSVINHYCRDLARRLGRPLNDDLGRELESVARRRIGMLFVFAARDPGIELLRTQGGSRVKKLRSQLQIELITGADHTFTTHRARNRLIEVLARALESSAHHD
jgi:alpha/beta superfamily hydrolase